MQSKQLGPELLGRGVKGALESLEDGHHRVRRGALLLLAHLSPTDPASLSHALDILSRFTSDTDFRVRMVSLLSFRYSL